MACEDLRRYLQAKRPSLDISFTVVVQNAFINGEDMDLTLVSNKAAKPELSIKDLNTSQQAEPSKEKSKTTDVKALLITNHSTIDANDTSSTQPFYKVILENPTS